MWNILLPQWVCNSLQRVQTSTKGVKSWFSSKRILSLLHCLYLEVVLKRQRLAVGNVDFDRATQWRIKQLFSFSLFLLADNQASLSSRLMRLHLMNYLSNFRTLPGLCPHIAIDRHSFITHAFFFYYIEDPKYRSYLSCLIKACKRQNTSKVTFVRNDVPCSSLAAVHMMSLQALK